MNPNPFVTLVTADDMAHPVNEYSTLENVKNELKRLNFESGLSWAKIGAKLGINKTVAWKIVNTNYEPQDAKVRMALNLPPFVPMQVCPKHGIVHAVDCPDERKKKLADKPKKPPLTPVQQRAKAVASLQRAISKAVKLELDPWWNTELADMQSCLKRIK